MHITWLHLLRVWDDLGELTLLTKCENTFQPNYHDNTDSYIWSLEDASPFRQRPILAVCLEAWNTFGLNESWCVYIYFADCGINCHKQCRELLVLACRKLICSGSLGSVSPARLTHSSLPSSPALPTCTGHFQLQLLNMINKVPLSE